MKRAAIVAGLVLLAFLCVIVLSSRTNSRRAPRYVAGKTQPTGNYTMTHYDWGSTRPFANDQVWIFGVRNVTNRFNCLYDLKQRVILGEVSNAGVLQANADGTKLLVLGRNNPATELKDNCLSLLEKISGGRISLNSYRTESFWVLNLKDNSSKRIGSVKEHARSGSQWCTSPSLRYGCTVPTTEWEKSLVLVDFQNDSFTRVALNGNNFCGWWDDQTVLLRDKRQDFLLHNVVSGQRKVLFSAETIRQTLEQLYLPSNPTNVTSFANWNGSEYDFYFTERDYAFAAKRGFVLKAERTSPTPTLKQVFQSFQFAWGGRFDAKAEHFLYQGESGSPGSGGDGAVYLRDVTYNSINTLVTPDNKGQYSIPRFYGDEVIYYRNHVLWRIGLDGSNNVPLFPTNSPASF